MGDELIEEPQLALATYELNVGHPHDIRALATLSSWLTGWWLGFATSLFRFGRSSWRNWWQTARSQTWSPCEPKHIVRAAALRRRRNDQLTGNAIGEVEETEDRSWSFDAVTVRLGRYTMRLRSRRSWCSRPCGGSGGEAC